MSTEIKLPTTVEEYERQRQLARREGFFSGAGWCAGRVARSGAPTSGETDDEAKKRFPIKRRVLRSACLTHNIQPAKVEPGTVLTVKLPDGRTHLCADDVAVLADLLARPYDEIEE